MFDSLSTGISASRLRRPLSPPRDDRKAGPLAGPPAPSPPHGHSADPMRRHYSGHRSGSGPQMGFEIASQITAAVSITISIVREVYVATIVAPAQLMRRLREICRRHVSGPASRGRVGDL